MAEIDLKSCPFCGAKYSAEKFTKNTVQLMKGTACFWAICLNCGSEDRRILQTRGCGGGMEQEGER